MILAHDIAQVLIDIQAVGVTLAAPITFKSGIQSPVYVDNRRLPFFPQHWRKIIVGFQQTIQEKAIAVDVIAGIESAGIPHSAALGYALEIPSVFVRKQPKEHGKQNRVEGGDVKGKQVLLIEDMVTTGSSSLSGVGALREAGASVENCFAITSYEFPEAAANFAAANVNLHILAPFSVIFEVMKANLSGAEVEAVESWQHDPYTWGVKR